MAEGRFRIDAIKNPAARCQHCNCGNNPKPQIVQLDHRMAFENAQHTKDSSNLSRCYLDLVQRLEQLGVRP